MNVTVNRITIKQVIKSPLFLCIVMQPILDIIAYIQYNNPIGTMAGYLRLAFVIVVPIFVFIKTSYKKGFLFSLLPIALLGLLHCANSFRVGYISFFEDMGYFIRTWYMPILAISFIFYFNHRKEKDYELMSKEIQYGFLDVYKRQAWDGMVSGLWRLLRSCFPVSFPWNPPGRLPWKTWSFGSACPVCW